MAVIKALTFREIVRPLRATFSTALGRKQHVHSVLVTVALDSGARGMGEVPTSLAFAGETVEVIKTTLAQAASSLKGKDIGGCDDCVAELRRRFPDRPMTISGLQVALFRASLQQRGESEAAYWGSAGRRITTDITIPFLTDAAPLGRWLAFAIRKGFTAFKLKVSGKLDEDKRVLSLLYDTLRERLPAFRLRLDGNQGFTAESFTTLLDYADSRGYAIELFEQPLPKDDFTGLAALTAASPVPVILDESVSSAADARRAVDCGAGCGFNIKIAKSGIRESAAIVQLARRHNMRLMIGCMMETMCGLSAAVRMAAGTGAFTFIDLDSVYFLYGSNRYEGIETRGPDFILAHET
jgi:L-alanine-DL-glutamate epimerase-like enolase superfamily enzyme